MNMYKAYKRIYNKVLKYKDTIDKTKKVRLAKNQTMTRKENNLKNDRRPKEFAEIMDIKNKLIKKNIEEKQKVPTKPAVNNSDNMKLLNDKLREQINGIIITYL